MMCFKSMFLTPDISRVSLLLFHFLDVFFRVFGTHFSTLFNGFQDNISHIFCHHFSITADVNVSTLFADQMPQLFNVFTHTMRHVNLFGLIPREGGVQGQNSILDVFFHFFAVNKIFVFVAAAEVQVGWTNGFTLSFMPSPFLNKSSVRNYEVAF